MLIGVVVPVAVAVSAFKIVLLAVYSSITSYSHCYHLAMVIIIATDIVIAVIIRLIVIILTTMTSVLLSLSQSTPVLKCVPLLQVLSSLLLAAV